MMKVQRPKTQSHGIWWAVFCLCPMILEGKHSLHKQWKLPKIMKYLLHTYLLQSTSGQRTHLLKKEFQLCKEEVFLFIYLFIFLIYEQVVSGFISIFYLIQLICCVLVSQVCTQTEITFILMLFHIFPEVCLISFFLTKTLH